MNFQSSNGYLKLNLGCRDVHIDGMVNVDVIESPAVDLCCDVKAIPLPDESCDLLYSSHCLEHIHYQVTDQVLKEWSRLLKLGGILRIYVPDFDLLIWEYIFSFDNVEVPPGSGTLARLKLCLKFYSSLHFFRLLPGVVGVILGHDLNGVKPLEHRALFNFNSLKQQLEEAGFINVRRLKPEERWNIDDASKVSFSLGIECEKGAKGDR